MSWNHSGVWSMKYIQWFLDEYYPDVYDDEAPAFNPGIFFCVNHIYSMPVFECIIGRICFWWFILFLNFLEFDISRTYCNKWSLTLFQSKYPDAAKAACRPPIDSLPSSAHSHPCVSFWTFLAASRRCTHLWRFCVVFFLQCDFAVVALQICSLYFVCISWHLS